MPATSQRQEPMLKRTFGWIRSITREGGGAIGGAIRKEGLRPTTKDNAVSEHKH